MKQVLFYVTFIVLCFGACYFCMNHNSEKKFGAQVANIEALSGGESGSNSTQCYNFASMDYNKAYINCHSCERIEGWKGIGTPASCSEN